MTKQPKIEEWMEVPGRGVDPTEAQVIWINLCEQDWDGDDNGITIRVRDGWEMSCPGEYVVKLSNGQYRCCKGKPIMGKEIR